MELQEYNDLLWDVSDTPIGSSTPDEFYELDYIASCHCKKCGEEIEGIAHYWSRDESFTSSWLHAIDYEPECPDEDNY